MIKKSTSTEIEGRINLQISFSNNNICGFGLPSSYLKEYSHFGPGISAHFGLSYCCITTSGSPPPLSSMHFNKYGTRIICKTTTSVTDCKHFPPVSREL